MDFNLPYDDPVPPLEDSTKPSNPLDFDTDLVKLSDYPVDERPFIVNFFIELMITYINTCVSITRTTDLDLKYLSVKNGQMFFVNKTILKNLFKLYSLCNNTISIVHLKNIVNPSNRTITVKLLSENPVNGVIFNHILEKNNYKLIKKEYTQDTSFLERLSSQHTASTLQALYLSLNTSYNFCSTHTPYVLSKPPVLNKKLFDKTYNSLKVFNTILIKTIEGIQYKSVFQNDLENNFNLPMEDYTENHTASLKAVQKMIDEQKIKKNVLHSVDERNTTIDDYLKKAYINEGFEKGKAINVSDKKQDPKTSKNEKKTKNKGFFGLFN
jgi:hypothetical protein